MKLNQVRIILLIPLAALIIGLLLIPSEYHNYLWILFTFTQLVISSYLTQRRASNKYMVWIWFALLVYWIVVTFI